MQYYFVNPLGSQFSIVFYSNQAMSNTIFLDSSSTYNNLVAALNATVYQGSSVVQWDLAGALNYVTSTVFAAPQFRNFSTAVVLLSLAET